MKQQPRTLTAEEMAKAIEVLRSTEGPITDAQRQEAIRQAIKEAEALAAKQQAERDDVNRDLQQVEAEIMRAKGQTPPAGVAVVATQGTPQAGTTQPPATGATSAEDVRKAQALLDQLTAADAQARQEAMATTATTAAPAPVKPAAPPAIAETSAQAPSTPAPSASAPGNTVPDPGAPLPISQSKEQQLAELLQRYMNDQISGAEYHKARREILSNK